MSDAIAAKYAALCQRLGDLEYKKSQIELDIDQVRSEMYGLNFTQSVILNHALDKVKTYSDKKPEQS